MEDIKKLEKIFLDTDNIKIIEACISQGVNVNLKNEEGLTKLWLACKNDNIELVKFLVTVPGIDVNAKGPNFGRSGMTLTSLFEIVKILKEAGADINALDVDGDSVIMFHYEDFNIIRYLVTSGADLTVKNKKGESIYDWVDDKSWLKPQYEFVLDEIDKLNTDEFDKLFKEKIKDLSKEKKKEYIKYLLNDTD